MASNPTLLIDVSRMLWRRWRGQLPTGIDRACLAYMHHFGDRAQAVVQRGGFTRVLARNQSKELITMLAEHREGFRRRAIALLARALVDLDGNSRSLRGATYLNLGHTGLDLPGHARWVRGSGVRAIYCIYDIIPITHPQFCRAGEAIRHAERMRGALSVASGILTISRESERLLAQFAGEQGLPMPPTLAVPLGISIRRPSNSYPPIAKPYFVMIGTIEGRKNYALALRIWEELAVRLGPDTPHLVIIGARGWAAEDVFAALDHSADLRRHVIERNHCSDDELTAYLTHACALLFPSFAEGQGLPLSEALAMGTPVIASNLAVFRETAEDIVDYLDPNDVPGWVELLLQYLAPNSGKRAAQVERLTHFKAPSWEQHFAEVEAWLDETTAYQ